jgi:hypothetical protein
LIKILKENKDKYYLPDLFKLTAGEELLASFDVDHITIETLLFQAGYLTIDKIKQFGNEILYDLKTPNHEIKSALTNFLVKEYLGFDNL